MQPAHTSGGRGTVFVDDDAGYARAIEGPGPWRIARFEGGFSSNTTVLTLPAADGCAVYVDVPSHKAIGIAALGIGPAKGAGNDWSPPWPREQVTDLIEAITALGRHLYRAHGLVGLWGVDTIWSHGRVVINEINVRNQGTTEVSGVSQVLRGLPPLLIAHLTVLAGGSVSWLPAPAQFNADTTDLASTTSRAPFYLKLRNTAAHPVIARNGWHGPGIYRLQTDELVWDRPGAHPAEADLDHGQVLLANAPEPGVTCAPGAELGTVEGLTTRPVFAGPDSLSPLGTRLHTAVRHAFTSPEGARS